MLRSSNSAALIVIAATTMVACNTSEYTAPVDHSALHATAAASSRSETAVEKAGLAKAVKAQLARFHSIRQAEKAGYEVASPCIAIPIGGMGFHYVQQGQPDETFDPMNPEALVYAPDAQGKLKLVAAEYIVMNIDQDRPSFEGQLFDIGGAPIPVAHWTLHVWLFEPNPLGMFAPFNPNVTCPAAEE